MTIRREGRELAVQALYSAEIEPSGGTLPLKRIVENFARGTDPVIDSNSRAFAFALELLQGVEANRAEVDRIIEANSVNWTITRMARVDLSILRLATYELVFCPDIPKNVTINEAVEVAKKFGADESSAFVNGILDEIASTLPDKG